MLQAVVCTYESRFCGFALDSNMNWHWYDDKTHTVVSHATSNERRPLRLARRILLILRLLRSCGQAGDDWNSVAAKCSISNYQPCLLIYQV